MANDIMNAVINPVQQSRTPVRLYGASPTDKVIDPRQNLPVTGEKLPPTKAKSPTTSDNLTNAVKQLNDYVQSVSRDLQFSIDKDSGVTVVKVIDSQTKEVIRQFPADEALKRAKALSQGKGLLIRAEA